MKPSPVLVAALLLAACGGGSSDSAPAPGATPSPTPSGASVIVPVAGPSRPVAADFNSYNFNLLRVASAIDDPALVSGLRALNPGSLRLPGGTPGEYWDWQRGGLRVGPYPGLPEPAPFTPDIRAIAGITPAVADRLLDNVGTPALFTANVLTATLDENLADIAAFRALGQPVTRIALGNEEYFRLPNNVARFPAARDYGVLARGWADAMRSAAPGTSIAVIAPSPLRNTGITFADWVSGLDAAGVWPSVDAVAIHPYFDTTTLAPLASPQAGEAMVAAMLAHDDDYLAQVEARLPAGKAIWITEWNVFEDQAAPVVGGSWLGGVANLARAVNFLSRPRVSLSVLHVAIGNRQWAALTDADGRTIDYAAGRPAVVQAPPFTLTATGETLALLGAATRGGGTAQRLDFGAAAAGRGIVGVRIAGADGRVREVLVNGSAATVEIRTNGQAELLSAPFDRGTAGTGTLQRSRFAITGERLAMPAFSVALVERP